VISRLRSIDLLRGCAALGVAIDHAIIHSPQLPVERWFWPMYVVLHYGHLGVPLFFVISRFCIHLQAARRRREDSAAGLNFVGFWKRRVFRLYPPYVAALGLSMALGHDGPRRAGGDAA
jgi:peptidoglycan/LPS O-acetylase OafA/YrhL